MDEEAWLETLALNQTSNTTRSSSISSGQVSQYSSFVACKTFSFQKANIEYIINNGFKMNKIVVIVMNYTMVMGILLLPTAYYLGGLVPTSIIMVLITFLMIIATFWIVEVSARAQALFASGFIDLVKLTVVTDYNNTIQQMQAVPFDQRARPDFRISSTKFEVNQLVRIFMGRKAEILYQVSISYHY